MVMDISGKKVFDSTSAHAVVIEALENEDASKALARRLWLSFVGEGRDALYKKDLEEVFGSQESGNEKAQEIFSLLDRDKNGDVSMEEMTTLILNIGQERKNRAISMHEVCVTFSIRFKETIGLMVVQVGQAIAVVDRLLGIVVLIAVALVYAAFFSTSFIRNFGSLWGAIAGLGFAIGGTVTGE